MHLWAAGGEVCQRLRLQFQLGSHGTSGVLRLPGHGVRPFAVRNLWMGFGFRARPLGLVRAIVDFPLAGGSLSGLEAAAGASAELWAQHGYSLERFALVSGAIVYDYPGRDNHIYPDKELGRAAVRAARPGVFPLGSRGAGGSAGCGGMFDRARSEGTGQGGAFRQVGQTRIAVFAVVNALGAILNRQGRVVRGNRDPRTGERRHPLDDLHERLDTGESTASPGGNTTLMVLITNQRLDSNALRQVARQVHGSLSRAIVPFHTPMDGDVLYAVTTNQVENEGLQPAALGMIASEVAQGSGGLPCRQPPHVFRSTRSQFWCASLSSAVWS